VWLATICTAVILAASNWPALTQDIVDRAFSLQNVALLWFVYPLVKAVHEAMHGYATKIHGGEVHEMGVMFLVLVPVPYVDASAAWAFRDKRRRMLVGAIGIMAELFLGAIALFVWLSVEPGTVRAIAYNVMLISGVSTLLFNGNPLLRFDGYYVLSDALEIPNLATRSNQYLGYLVRRYLFGSSQARSPADSAGEARWFVLYGTAAFAYRVFILSVIVLYVGSRFFVVGVLLALWALLTQVAVPVAKNIRFVLQSPELSDNRGRAIRVTAGTIAGTLILLLAVPVPSWTRAQGVVWPPERSQLRAAAAGTVREILVADGTLVEQGEPLILTEDPELEARVRVLESQQQEFERQLTLARTIDQVQTDLAREELAAVSAGLERAREQLKALTIRSPRSGTLIVPRSQDLAGRYVGQGEMLAFVIDDADRLSVRAVIDQDHIGQVRDNVRRVDVFQTRWSAQAFPAELARAVPGGTTVLPTAALGSAAGGDIPVDPRDDEGRTTLEPVFEFEVTMPPEAEQRFIGHRMYVRFDHGYEPAGWQLYRVIRQLLLSRFDV
jgi:putative peptide zinc metalloprotease protein